MKTQKERNMKMNLYEIEKEILNCVDTETGEIINIEALNALKIQRDVKIENIALWIKNLLSDAEQIKAEKDVLEKREKVIRNKAESLKKYLSDYMGGGKFSTPRVVISFRKSESVEIPDIEKLKKLDNADSYLKYSDPVPDKAAIKQAIKGGVEIPGCSLVEKNNIQIK